MCRKPATTKKSQIFIDTIGFLGRAAPIFVALVCTWACTCIVCDSHIHFAYGPLTEEREGGGPTSSSATQEDDDYSVLRPYVNVENAPAYRSDLCTSLYRGLGGTRENFFFFGLAIPVLALSCLAYIILGVSNSRRYDSVEHGVCCRNRKEDDKSQEEKTTKSDNCEAILPPIATNTRSIFSLLSAWRFCRNDSFPVNFFVLLFVLAPCIVVCFDATRLELPTFAKVPQPLPFVVKLAFVQALPTGVAAVVSLSFFLIPVSKHSPLLSLLNISYARALGFHRLAGWISLWFTLVHSILICLILGFAGALKGAGFWRGMIEEIFPPRRCWQSSSVVTASWFNQEDGHDGCYPYFRNFAGFVSTAAFVALALTSLWTVRRRFYDVFYATHVVAGWIMMLAAIVHYPTVVLYILPTILYYLACNVPVYIQQWCSHRRSGDGGRGGVRLVSATLINDSGGCVELDFGQVAKNTHGSCKLCVPEVSPVWHPFSTLRGPDGSLRVLYRSMGPFTKSLSARLFDDIYPASEKVRIGIGGKRSILSSRNEVNGLDATAPPSSSSSLSSPTPSYSSLSGVNDAEANVHVGRESPTPPLLLVDAMYQEGNHWLPNILGQHDVVLLVAGGVGIVPFVHLLEELLEALVVKSEGYRDSASGRNGTVRNVILHWYCREVGLCRHVWKRHLGVLLRRYHAESLHKFGCMFEINIHVTSMDKGDESGSEASCLGRILQVDKQDDDDFIEDDKEGKDIVYLYHSKESKTSTLEKQGYKECSSPPLRISRTMIQNTIADNVVSLATFGTIGVVGCIFYVWQYTCIVAVYEKKAFPRIYSFCLSALASIVIGTLAEALSRREKSIFASKKESRMRGRGNTADNDGSEVCPLIETTVDVSVVGHQKNWKKDGQGQLNEPETSRFSGGAAFNSASDESYRTFPTGEGHGGFLHGGERSDLGLGGGGTQSSPITVKAFGGRPTVSSVIGPIVSENALRPGAFFCGPSGLLRSVQLAIEEERRCRRTSVSNRCEGFLCARTDCVIYEEPSEM